MPGARGPPADAPLPFHRMRFAQRDARSRPRQPKTEVPSSFAKASVEVVPRKHPALSKRVLKIFSTSSDSPKSTQPSPFIGECSTILRIACAFLLGCPDFGLLQTRSEYLQHPLTSRAPANPFFSISSCLALRAGHAWFQAKRQPLVGWCLVRTSRIVATSSPAGRCSREIGVPRCARMA